MTPEITKAVAFGLKIAKHLQPADREDLEQELLIELLKSHENLKRSARRFVRERLWHRARDEERRQRFLAGLPYLQDARLTSPKWYPPHPDANPGDWLACAGARVMSVK